MLYPDGMPLVRTKIEPWREIEVTEAERLSLERLGLLYTGDIVVPPPSFSDSQYSELANPNGEAARRVIEAVGASELIANLTTQLLADVDSRGYVDGVYVGTEIAETVDESYVAGLLAEGLARASVLDIATSAAGSVGKVRNARRLDIQADYVFYATPFGDWNPAIEQAIADLAPISGTDAISGVLYFAPGQYFDSGNHVIPDTKRIIVEGAGATSTLLRRSTGATGDWWTINSKDSGVRDLTLDGRRYQNPTAGDSLVLNGAYTFARDVFVNKSAANGITIGKAGAAVVHSLIDVRVRECAAHGIATITGSESTDGIWTAVEVGLCGQSGVYLGVGSQNIKSLHVWGSGLEDTTNRHGVWVNSQTNTFVNLQSESNNGFGLQVTGARNVFVGGRIWQNQSAGIRGISATYLTVIGMMLYRNAAVNGASGTASLGFSAIYLTNTPYHVIVGCSVWDDNVAFSPVDYSKALGAPPTYPNPGRVAQRSQAYGYTADGTSNYGTIVGNSMPRELMRTTSGPIGFADGAGNDDVIFANQWGSGGLSAPTVAPVAGAVRAPSYADFVYVSGASTITSILGHRLGRRISLYFVGPGAGQVTDDGDTLNLAGNLATANGVMLSLVSDGAKWRETSRVTL